MLNASKTQALNGNGIDKLKSEVEYRAKLQEIGNKINAARDLDEILFDLKDDITGLFLAERMTVYVVDGVKRELVSRFKSGHEIGEIRVAVNKSSLAGYAALTHKLLNIENVYDADELESIDENLKFDKSWDQKTGYRTKQVLVYPIIFQKYLMGALQMVNRLGGDRFGLEDEKAIADLAKIIGIALYNQKRMAVRGGRTTKFDYLLENHLVTQKELTKAVTDARQRKESVETLLVREYKVPKTELGESLARYFKVPFVSYNASYPIPGELLSGLKVPFMRTNVWVPIRNEDTQPVIAIDDPHDLKRIDEIKALFPGQKLKFMVALKQDILDFIKLFTADEREMAEIDDILSQLQDETQEIEEAEHGVGEEDSAVVQLVNKIILDAYARNASDIHVEPYAGKQNTMVRIRVDGACTIYQTIPFAYRNAVVSRIKIMSDLDIAERRLPQDGKIKFKKYGGKDIELRVATIPTQGGLEDVVMRILAAGEPIPLEKMGFSEQNYENFIKSVVKPYGLILVCGPTGSGKTTT
ncbi:MAG: Flp pilus assembly complex ATPase component TadA, partial [Desulfatitalea sp.]|nr:Flp pilus assembly complex ATPase component TadA [Desulfatitalea sp.]NNK01969.1 Flp pilus assembly complex ATPase component TadA [Desulfatitalea sp.]